jgi:Nitrile hydratase beta subunit
MDPRDETPGRAANDQGGLPAGPLAVTDHALLPWEKSTHAVVDLLAVKGVVSVEEKRRGIDELGRDLYDRLTYYEKWILSASNNLLAKGVLTSEELARKMDEVAKREAGRGREVCP